MSQTVEEQLDLIREELEAQGKAVRRIDRRMRYATYGSILKWVVYAGVAFSVFTWLQPYLEAIIGVAQKIEGTAGAVSGFRQSWSEAFRGFAESFTGGAQN